MYFHLGHQPKIVVHKQMKFPEEISQLGFARRNIIPYLGFPFFGITLLYFGLEYCTQNNEK